LIFLLPAECRKDTPHKRKLTTPEARKFVDEMLMSAGFTLRELKTRLRWRKPRRRHRGDRRLRELLADEDLLPEQVMSTVTSRHSLYVRLPPRANISPPNDRFDSRAPN
jgi:polyhydroxyalkanoate synthesis regulator phasin